MTKLLQQAFDAISKLPDAEQDAVAEQLLRELEDERRWDESFLRSQDALERLAQKAREDVRGGKSREIGIDEL
jgi:hypothetical protein